uniref:hypothetical protein n=1 Tax=Roseivirga sp. TaxID=1964215 RepID=UPI004047F783
MGGGKSKLRSIVQFWIWKFFIAKTLKSIIKDADLVITCNDYAAPFLYLSAYLIKKKVKYVCLQEGIRFHQPGDTRIYYGTYGADYLVAWGKNSIDHFLPVVQKRTKLIELGTPIYDNILIDNENKLGILHEQLIDANNVVAFLSNPVEDIGFCSKDEKLLLFENLLIRLKTYFENGLYLLLRVHPREDINEFLSISNRLGLGDKVVSTQMLTSIFSTLAIAERAIVMASTAGVDSLIANKPLAILKVYDNDFGHDYVQSGAAFPLVLDNNFDLNFNNFLNCNALSTAALNYRDQNMINIGTAAKEISTFIHSEVLK